MTAKKYKNGNWGYYFGHEGKRYRKQGYKTKREAVEAETKAKNDLLDGFQFDNNVTLHNYFKEWAETYKEPNVSKKNVCIVHNNNEPFRECYYW